MGVTTQTHKIHQVLTKKEISIPKASVLTISDHVKNMYSMPATATTAPNDLRGRLLIVSPNDRHDLMEA